MPYTNTTLATFKNLILNRLQNASFWSTTELRDAVNEGIRVLQVCCGLWTDRYVITTQGKRVIYTTTSVTVTTVDGNIPQIFMPIRMAFNSIPLDPCTLNDMDNGYPGWQFQTTSTTGCPDTPIMWGPIGLTKFFIWPADNDGANSLQVDCLKRAPVLVADSDYLNIDSSYISPLVGYCQHVLMLKRGGQLFSVSMNELRAFMKTLVDKNGHLQAVEPFRRFMGEEGGRRSRPRKAKDLGGIPMLGVKT
jgi:hypothetical protein